VHGLTVGEGRHRRLREAEVRVGRTTFARFRLSAVAFDERGGDESDGAVRKLDAHPLIAVAEQREAIAFLDLRGDVGRGGAFTADVEDAGGDTDRADRRLLLRNGCRL